MARASRSRDLNIQPSDFIGRLGGEEFAAVLCKGVDASERSWGPALRM
jgi:GGDEF domain-containing protein